MQVVEFAADQTEIKGAGNADFVLSFRNLHNWLSQGRAEQAIAQFHKALKPGGILGITDHRGRPDQPQDPQAKSGYVRQDYAIALIEKAGFKLAGTSEAGANPKDTKDHPAGVWTLPPTYRLKDQDQGEICRDRGERPVRDEVRQTVAHRQGDKPGTSAAPPQLRQEGALSVRDTEQIPPTFRRRPSRMRFTMSALALIAGAGPVLAADINANSRIDGVTVFPQGAEVRRLAKVRIEAGDHTVIFPDLPANAQPASIRVEGKATGGLEIGSVDSRRLAVPRGDPAAVASARRRIEEEIEKLRDERARIQADLQAAEMQRTYLTSLAQLPGRPAPQPPAAAGAREDWAGVLGLIAKELAPVNKAILDAQVRTRDVDRRIRDAEGRLRAEAGNAQDRIEVKVAVAARAAIEAELVVRYQVAEASWQPVYDARLAAGSKTQAPKLTITRRAMITQKTPEAWDGVALALSTTRPAAGTAAPELRTVTVDYPPDRPVPTAAVRQVAPAAAPARRDDTARWRS